MIVLEDYDALLVMLSRFKSENIYFEVYFDPEHINNSDEIQLNAKILIISQLGTFYYSAIKNSQIKEISKNIYKDLCDYVFAQTKINVNNGVIHLG